MARSVAACDTMDHPSRRSRAAQTDISWPAGMSPGSCRAKLQHAPISWRCCTHSCHIHRKTSRTKMLATNDVGEPRQRSQPVSWAPWAGYGRRSCARAGMWKSGRSPSGPPRAAAACPPHCGLSRPRGCARIWHAPPAMRGERRSENARAAFMERCRPLPRALRVAGRRRGMLMLSGCRAAGCAARAALQYLPAACSPPHLQPACCSIL